MAVKGERPQNYKSISQDTQKNLVALTYLHSNPYNFRNAVAIGSTSSLFNLSSLQSEAINKLNKLINLSAAKERQFYELVSNGQSHTIESMQRLINQSLKYFEVFKKLNTKEFLDSLDSGYQNQIEALALEYLSKTKEDYTENEFFDYERMKEDVTNTILDIFNSTKRKGQKPVKASNKDFQKYFKNMRKKLYLPVVQNGNVGLYNKMLSYIRKQGINDPSFEKAFKEAFDATTMNGAVELVVNNKSNIIGFIGEMSTTILLQEFLRNLQNTNLRYQYIGEIKQNGVKSPVDFIIDKYGIQVKNSLSESSTNNVKIQSNITIQSFIDKLENYSNGEELKYLLVNISYLQYFGRPNKLKMADINDSILNYINMALSSFADLLLSTEIEEQDVNSYKNNFFFYKNKYLIPTSIMLEGIKQTLESYQNQNNIGENAIGYINKNLGKKIKIGDVSVSENSKQIQEHKRSLLTGLPSNEYTYGGELGRYGGELGTSAARSAKININYTLINKNLDKINSILRL